MIQVPEFNAWSSLPRASPFLSIYTQPICQYLPAKPKRIQSWYMCQARDALCSPRWNGHTPVFSPCIICSGNCTCVELKETKPQDLVSSPYHTWWVGLGTEPWTVDILSQGPQPYLRAFFYVCKWLDTRPPIDIWMTVAFTGMKGYRLGGVLR